jgi:hypothetical protein
MVRFEIRLDLNLASWPPLRGDGGLASWPKFMLAET